MRSVTSRSRSFSRAWSLDSAGIGSESHGAGGGVKVCGGEGCGWMFLDESRNVSRRWCDSRDCGNCERVRKYLARKHASDS